MHLSPADYVVRVFKGVRATARLIGRSPTSVSKWTMPKAKRGSNGMIPSQAQRIILLKARALGLDLTAEDLILGREIID